MMICGGNEQYSNQKCKGKIQKKQNQNKYYPLSYALIILRRNKPPPEIK